MTSTVRGMGQILNTSQYATPLLVNHKVHRLGLVLCEPLLQHID